MDKRKRNKYLTEKVGLCYEHDIVYLGDGHDHPKYPQCKRIGCSLQDPPDFTLYKDLGILLDYISKQDDDFKSSVMADLSLVLVECIDKKETDKIPNMIADSLYIFLKEKDKFQVLKKL